MSILHTIYVMGIVLGIMILLHEFGHYAAAKFFGVRVEQFAIGFGKRLFGFHRGGTDYRINILPLGGYVKMSGENPMDERTDDPGEFLNHPRWQRFVIAIAGPAMNVLLAFALWTGVFMVHYEYSTIFDGPAFVGWVAPGTPAANAGIQPGDKIVRVDDTENPNWEQVLYKEALSPNQPLKFQILRAGVVSDITLVPQPMGRNQAGDVGFVPKEPRFIATMIEPDMPAEKAGLKVGDQILSVNGQEIPAVEALVDMLARTKDQPLDVVVLRDGQKLPFTVHPKLSAGNPPGDMRYRIGLASNPTKVVKLPFPQAVSKAAGECVTNSSLILELVRKMVAGKISIRQVDGPIGIGSAVGSAAREEGWTPLLFVSAIISLNLGVMNLLPIPILDGGVILLLIIESLMQKDISLPIKERIYQAAFVFLVLFAVTVI
ncbi:MAG: RIP metalloprotease RseP, partial [Terriglobales bacterium]